MLKTTVFISTFLISVFGFSQDSIRFNSSYFDEVVIKTDVVYGESTSQGGETEQLTMDVYQPLGDESVSRPLIILAHGGYFVFGDKDSFTEECIYFAKAGYVAVSINYRLIDIEGDSIMTPKYAVIDAVNDMKAAVRYFTKDALAESVYRIDTSNVIVGGYSAGAITSLHYAYANSSDDVLAMGGAELLQYVEDNGGLEGMSGNPGFSSKIKAVVNIAGSLHSATLVDNDEAALYSVHGTSDMTVPFERGLASGTLVETEGSGLIHQQADKVGLQNLLHEIPDSDHAAFYSCGECLDEMRSFLFELVSH